MRKIRFGRRQSGFSLIEVMASVTILATAAFIAAQAATDSARYYSRDLKYLLAAEIGESTLESLLLALDSDTRISAGDHTQNFNREGKSVATESDFTVRWTVRPNTPIDLVTEIQMDVEWQEMGHTRQLRLTTHRTW